MCSPYYCSLKKRIIKKPSRCRKFSYHVKHQVSSCSVMTQPSLTVFSEISNFLSMETLLYPVHQIFPFKKAFGISNFVMETNVSAS